MLGWVVIWDGDEADWSWREYSAPDTPVTVECARTATCPEANDGHSRTEILAQRKHGGGWELAMFSGQFS